LSARCLITLSETVDAAGTDRHDLDAVRAIHKSNVAAARDKRDALLLEKSAATQRINDIRAEINDIEIAYALPRKFVSVFKNN
jgi:hypothetical protein